MAKKRSKRKEPEKPPTFDAATEAELDAAAEITAEDIALAQESFRSRASPRFRSLLDAEPDAD